MPLRDDRRGRRATLSGGSVPLRPDFGALAANGEAAATPPAGPLAPERVAPVESHETEPRESSTAQQKVSAAMPPPADDPEPAAPTPPAATEEPNPSATAHFHRAHSDDEHEPVPSDAFDEPDFVKSPSPTLGALHVRPLELLVATWERLVHAFRAPISTLPSTGSTIDDVVVQRSFAGELASLLGTKDTDEPKAVQTSIADADTADATVFRADDAVPVDERVHDPAANETAAVKAAPLQSIVVPPVRTPIDRVVPLTRLPLRPQSSEITWFSSLNLAQTPQTAHERHALLDQLLADRARAQIAVLTQAYHEEDPRGRVLALRALEAFHAREAIGTFVDALHAGTDDERVAAIDALAAADARDALPPAFADRVEAIAAHAALAYVGTNVREDYVRTLARYVDAARIEAILALLAGFVE